MQINLFSGGLNTRLGSHMIDQSESVILQNVDIESGVLAPIKGLLDTTVSINKYFYGFKTNWVSSSTNRDYIEYQNSLLWSGYGVEKPQKSNGTTNYNLGIVKPSSAPIVNSLSTIVSTSNYQYCYTYYNTNDGTESQPSVYTADAVGLADLTLTVSSDAQVTHKRIYRIGGNLSVMSLVATVTNATTSYVDTLADNLIDGTVLASYNYREAQIDMKYLVQSNAVFFMATGSRLYFSEIGNPNYWPVLNFITFDADITGIGVTSNGVVVFTYTKTFIVTGTSPDVFVKYLVSNDQGCINHKSIQYLKGTMVWLSTDGICSSNGSSIDVLSRDKLGKLAISVETCAVIDDTYYVITSTGYVLVMDLRYGLKFYNLQLTAEYLAVYNDELYAYSSGKLWKCFAGTTLSMSYETGLISEGSLSNSKLYNSIYFYFIGIVEVEVYIDESLIATIELSSISSAVREYLVPASYQRGYTIKFSITGTGKLYEIEYKVTPRQKP